MITIDDQSGVTVVSLSRPPVNALDLPMIEKLGSTFSDLAETAVITGVVLTGAGSAFSAGVDTKAYLIYHKDQRRALALAITKMTASILSLPCPLVAAVNGHALGGGFILMLCCDYRLVANIDTLRLGLTEARAGVPFPAGPVVIMKHELPAALLRQLTLSSRTMSPGVLAEYAVVDDLTDPELILRNAVSTARDLASQAAFKIVKRQVRGALGAELRLFAANGVDPFLTAFG
jgi:enoyl-CoA hydratase